MHSLNLGILAHVDAGKTSLTERLLYAAGVIDQLGSVDQGTTQTDTLALERKRGITIKSAVTSFVWNEASVNLIDTPGHPDFIAEVERVLKVLDAAVLVVSAVEGVQPQTRVLMRALKRLRVPTLLFVNKIDRVGARTEPLLQEMAERLSLALVPMGSVSSLGTPRAEFEPWDEGEGDQRPVLTEALAERDESLLARYVGNDAPVPVDLLREKLMDQASRGIVHPVFFGSALTGAGVEALMTGITDLLPAAAGDSDAPVSGAVFKIDWDARGGKVAYVRMFSGTIRVRDRLAYGHGHEDKVTAIGGVDRQSVGIRASVSADDIATVSGLHQVQIGDQIGQVGASDADPQFLPPTMEAVVDATNPAERGQLWVALKRLSEQDPLINARRDHRSKDISVSLYGEVQKEVIQSMLVDDFHVQAQFRDTTTICVERPVRQGTAIELLTSDANPYMATVGLQIEPGAGATGVQFRLDADARSVPFYIYKTMPLFIEHMEQYVRGTLRHGLHGWEVTDCLVTMTACGYYTSDGPRKPHVPMSRTTSADFRKLTPIVLRRALERAGTQVCRPVLRLSVEVPSNALGELLTLVTRLGGVVNQASARGDLSTIDVRMPADRSLELQRQLPGVSAGEGTVETAFDGYQPVRALPR